MTTDQIRDCRQQIKPPAVELHHRLGEAEAEARARLRAALLQPHEALGGALAVVLVGNARPVVGDGRLISPSCLLDA